MAESGQVTRNKRKRKKTFLSNARKYGKRGYFGRGVKIDEDTYQYFVRIMETYKEGFPNEEEKEIFCNNVFEQTNEQELTVACNQFGCRVIETLLPFANDAAINKFMTAFGDDLRRLCSDRFASHVVEALLAEATKRSKNSSQKDTYIAFVIKVSRFLLNNMEDYMWDTYGNPVMRSVFYTIAEIPKEKDKLHIKVKDIVEDKQPDADILEEFKEIVKDYGQRLLSWPQFPELPGNELTSGFLQVLLKALQKIDVAMLDTYVKRFCKEFLASKADDSLPKVFESNSKINLLETCLMVSTPKCYSKLYKNCFKKRLAQLSVQHKTYFAVEKLLKFAQDKTEYEEMFDELADSFKEIIDNKCTTILLTLGETCKKLGAKQGSFIQNMMKALNCYDTPEQQSKFIICLCKLQPREVIEQQQIDLEKEKLNLHGTLILQYMLEFNKPIKLVNALLEMEQHALQGLLSNTMGSHITDSYVSSAFVGEKSRERLLRTLQGTYQHLAGTKFGSRSFEALWNVANLKFRMNIMDELAYKDAAWANSLCGKIIADKVQLQVYKKSKDEWKSAINTSNTSKKPKNLLEDVVGAE